MHRRVENSAHFGAHYIPFLSHSKKKWFFPEFVGESGSDNHSPVVSGTDARLCEIRTSSKGRGSMKNW
jgi:hypothetical protein